MLSNMTYLNVRHTLPMLGWQARSFKFKTSMTPTKMHGRRREASADLGATQVRIDIDSYESRKAYGFRKDADLCRAIGREAGYESPLKRGVADH